MGECTGHSQRPTASPELLLGGPAGATHPAVNARRDWGQSEIERPERRDTQFRPAQAIWPLDESHKAEEPGPAGYEWVRR